MLLPIIAYYCIWWSSLNFHDYSYNSWLVQDITSRIFHLYTLDLSTNRFFQSLRNLCERHADLFHLGQLHADLFNTGSGHWIPLYGWNQMWAPGQRSRAQERAPRPFSHQTGSEGAQVHVTRNNVKIKHGYYLLLHIIDLPPKRQSHSQAVLAFLSTFCTQVNKT